MKTDAEVVDDAIDLIQTGWCQGKFYQKHYPWDEQSDDEFCTVGAIQEAAVPGYHTRGMDASNVGNKKIKGLLHSLSEYLGLPIATWNDSVVGSKEDVLLKLKEFRERIEDLS